MNIKRFNISKPKKYEDRDGNEKTQWNNIGTITEFHKDDGKISRIIEIPAIGLEANIFPIEPKESDGYTKKQTPKRSNNDENQDIEYPDEDVNPEDIPF